MNVFICTATDEDDMSGARFLVTAHIQNARAQMLAMLEERENMWNEKLIRLQQSKSEQIKK